MDGGALLATPWGVSATAPQVPPRGDAPRGTPVVALVMTVAALYLAREVLIPVALAALLTFLLAPATRRLEHLGAGRGISTFLVAVLAFTMIGAVGWVVTNQAVSLAAKLPEYRVNITKKIRALKGTPQGELGKAAEAVKEIHKQAVPAAPPLAVTETPASPFAQLADLVAPFGKPVGTALAVIVFTILLLLNRDNLRERLIALMGARHIHVTTQALGEVSERVSRYLLMQLFVNSCFGVPFGIALYLIGMPNAALWGLLAIVLRFIPYVGAWVAAALPVLLGFAISDDWSLVAWTLGVFFALELTLVYALEPWLYGRSTGLSAIAVMAATVFWTWLWGPVGLLLATPLTVCVVVVGRYIPQLSFLSLMLGAEPALPPGARFYQRLLSQEIPEAVHLAREYRDQHGEVSLYEDVLIAALRLAERDRQGGALTLAAARSIDESIQQLLVETEGTESQAQFEGSSTVCIAPARDGVDHVAAQMMARLLPAPEFTAVALAHSNPAAETLEAIEARGCKTVLISALQPPAASNAESLCRRLRQRFPELKILVGLWAADGDVTRAAVRLKAAGADEVVTTLHGAVQRVREHAIFGFEEPSRAVA
jgi:predicted PurR-regulated permease PerM